MKVDFLNFSADYTHKELKGFVVDLAVPGANEFMDHLQKHWFDWKKFPDELPKEGQMVLIAEGPTRACAYFGGLNYTFNNKNHYRWSLCGVSGGDAELSIDEEVEYWAPIPEIPDVI